MVVKEISTISKKCQIIYIITGLQVAVFNAYNTLASSLGYPGQTNLTWVLEYCIAQFIYEEKIIDLTLG